MKAIRNISGCILLLIVLIAIFDAQPNIIYPSLSVIEQTAMLRVWGGQLNMDTSNTQQKITLNIAVNPKPYYFRYALQIIGVTNDYLS